MSSLSPIICDICDDQCPLMMANEQDPDGECFVLSVANLPDKFPFGKLFSHFSHLRLSHSELRAFSLGSSRTINAHVLRYY